ncbi:hypothetical protein KUTeg_005863 [Tegillarca granosa]|nr:hypothetical protein KUTeg_012337 [Tegillarca granosa]KAJ8310814.1 hypothetical protein KUTeg_012679 [Tegillarca granosa]KAJ8314281.1 hypothetical protein KUTeg_008842 [Tegillarca granosa]KAJ8316587.1 hypothetical protein KUTeg_005863 [Tegillarca granosa]
MCIDIFSRKLYLKTLKNKQSSTVVDGFKKIFEHVKPEILRTDSGGEFNNRVLKKYLDSLSIKHIITRNSTKANYIERLNRTFRTLLYRYFQQNNTYKYLDVLDDLITTYNNRPHRSLDYHTPNSVTKENSFKFWHTQYIPPLKLSELKDI